jgi:hypothetical protein
LAAKPDFTIRELKTAPFESDAYVTRWPDGLQKKWACVMSESERFSRILCTRHHNKQDFVLIEEHDRFGLTAEAIAACLCKFLGRSLASESACTTAAWCSTDEKRHSACQFLYHYINLPRSSAKDRPVILAAVGPARSIYIATISANSIDPPKAFAGAILSN